MFTNISSHFSQVQKNFISTNIFPILSKANNKIVVVALAAIAAISTLFVVSRCFINHKIPLSPTSPTSDVLPKKMYSLDKKIQQSVKVKPNLKSPPFSPISEEYNLSKSSQPTFSDEEYALALELELADEEDVELALKLQTEFEDKEQIKYTKPFASEIKPTTKNSISPFLTIKTPTELSGKKNLYPFDLSLTTHIASDKTKKHANLSLLGPKPKLLDDEEYARFLAQQFAEEDGGDFESVMRLQKEFDTGGKKVKPIISPNSKPNRASDNFSKSFEKNLYPLLDQSFSKKQGIQQDKNSFAVQNPAIVPLFPDSEEIAADSTSASITKIEDVWNKISNNAINSSFSEKIDPKVHLEIDDLFNDLITKWEKHFSILTPLKRGQKFPTTVLPFDQYKYYFLLAIYNLYLYGPTIIDNLTRIQKKRNELHNYSNLIKEYCLTPFQELTHDYFDIKDVDQVILTAVRLSYMLAEVADLAKKSKQEELRNQFYLDFFKQGIPIGCFKGKTNHLVVFCIKWKDAFETPPAETVARNKLQNGDFGQTLKYKNHHTVIHETFTHQKLYALIAELNLEKNDRPLDKWLEDEQGKIIDYLKEKGIWKTVLYHKEAGETYYLLDEGTLQAFLKEFHISLVW